jgi:hypothetical protein
MDNVESFWNGIVAVKKNLLVIFALLTLAFIFDLYWKYRLVEPFDRLKSLCVICISSEKIEDYACPAFQKREGSPVSAESFADYILSFTKPLVTTQDITRIIAVSSKKAATLLDGLDLKHHRPKVLVIGTIDPLSLKSNHTLWEPMLLAQNYFLVLFDGDNRYYLAGEQRELLQPLMTAGKCACIENKVHHLQESEIYVSTALVRPSIKR